MVATASPQQGGGGDSSGRERERHGESETAKRSRWRAGAFARFAICAAAAACANLCALSIIRYDSYLSAHTRGGAAGARMHSTEAFTATQTAGLRSLSRSDHACPSNVGTTKTESVINTALLLEQSRCLRAGAALRRGYARALRVADRSLRSGRSATARPPAAEVFAARTRSALSISSATCVPARCPSPPRGCATAPASAAAPLRRSTRGCSLLSLSHYQYQACKPWTVPRGTGRS